MYLQQQQRETIDLACVFEECELVNWSSDLLSSFHVHFFALLAD